MRCRPRHQSKRMVHQLSAIARIASILPRWATFYRHIYRRHAAMLIPNPLTGQMVEVRVPRPRPRTA